MRSPRGLPWAAEVAVLLAASLQCRRAPDGPAPRPATPAVPAPPAALADARAALPDAALEASAPRAPRSALPAEPVVERACDRDARTDWVDTERLCASAEASALTLARFDARGHRYAVLLHSDARLTRIDLPVRYRRTLWIDGERRAPAAPALGSVGLGGGPSDDVLALLRAELPRVTGVDPAGARRWLLALALAAGVADGRAFRFDDAGRFPSAPARAREALAAAPSGFAQEAGRTRLRVWWEAQSFGMSIPRCRDFVRLELWLEDDGRWDTHTETLRLPRPGVPESACAAR